MIAEAIATRTPSNQHVHKAGPSRKRIKEAPPLDINYHRDVDESTENMNTQGFVAFDQLLNKEENEELRTLMNEIGEDMEHYRSDWGGKPGPINKHIGCPFVHNEAFLKYCDKPGAIDIIKNIHGPGTRVIGGSVWITGPGRPPMGLHIDYQPFGLPEDIAMDPRVKIPIMISTLHYYLNDSYPELGPTVIIPGSHRAGRAPNGESEWNGTPVQAFQCKGGDALLFRSDLWHGAMPNISNENRYMLQVHYGTPYIASTYQGFHKRAAVSEGALNNANKVQRNLMGERQGDEPGSYLVHDFVRRDDREQGVFFA